MSRRPARPVLRRPVALTAALATGLAPLAVTLGSPAAAADIGGVVISEVYGGGGSSTSAWQRDYVELHNPTDTPVDLAGTSVQYRSSGGRSDPTGVTPLSGTIPAGGYFLVGQATGTAGAATPTPHVTGTFAMSGTAGTVFLADRPTALTAPPTGSLTDHPGVVDLVGYGSTNTYETAPTVATSTTTSAARDTEGTDTDDNSADLAVEAGTPGAGPDSDPGGPPATATIAEIQGTGDRSPLEGRMVTTTGVVTAAYPTGGFNGFYLQTAGTGGAMDPAGHEASDAVFVYGSAATAKVERGDHVEVTGPVTEYAGLTELTPAAADVRVLADPAAVQPTATAWPREEADRERLEGMLLEPQGPFTVADNYALNRYAEIGLASGTEPLPTPTDVADPHDADAIEAVTDDNAARAVTLDDGSSTNFFTDQDTPLPYLTQQPQLRVGAPVGFAQPVVLDWRFGAWRFQPTSALRASDPLPVSVGHTRTAAPEPVGGNVRIASMNVLNYFPTTGADFVAAGGECSWYDDRAGDHVTVRTCTGPGGEQGPRGAAEQEDLARQQAKIVSAIDGLDADVVSLEEIENSAKFGQPRDAAVATLVDALNAEAGAGTWAFVPTPGDAGDQADEDVIRTAFVYRTDAVEPVGESVIHDVPVFDVARDPLAQAFEPVGGTSYSRFVVIVNHFKSKGSGPDDGTGQGNSNPQRVAEAQELVRFAEDMKVRSGSEKVFLSGDFNAYTREDPMQVLYDAGYTDVGAAHSSGEATYLFGGTVGSLDHVLGNDAASEVVTGADVWNISSVEPVALEYSRHNYNATDFYAPGPYRASDHDPLVVGLDLPLGAVPTATDARVTPDVVRHRVERPVVEVEVTSPAGTVRDGRVLVRERGRHLGSGVVEDGAVRIELDKHLGPGRHVLTVTYLGTEETRPSRTTATVTVVKDR